jgi:hypothetical protein
MYMQNIQARVMLESNQQSRTSILDALAKRDVTSSMEESSNIRSLDKKKGKQEQCESVRQ